MTSIPLVPFSGLAGEEWDGAERDTKGRTAEAEGNTMTSGRKRRAFVNCLPFWEVGKDVYWLSRPASMKRTLITARSPGPFDAATCTVWMIVSVCVETRAESVVDAS
ncbi:hypothetical protein H0G86_008664 [Trichoderma simmonsii]|uniref:Uncharacterized protein n=1 Tax=Trichoderma simmonsii TaxID=1491479 RepID=A0A8G0LFZ9_9HYPO|nr:hypothetical protein H0G86_008664 [Trichoderma simmonsii]